MSATASVEADLAEVDSYVAFWLRHRRERPTGARRARAELAAARLAEQVGMPAPTRVVEMRVVAALAAGTLVHST